MRRITTRATLALAAACALAACNKEDRTETEAALPDSAAKPNTAVAEQLATWDMRLDQATADASGFAMAEQPGGGWAIKTGPNGAAITWRDQDMVEGGAFEARATIEERSAPAEHREAYGLFVGGRNLQQPDQQYTYFLVRGSGDYLIKRREGEATPTLVDWSPSPAVHKVAQAGDLSENALEIRVEPELTRFFVNGTEVKSLPTEQVKPYGTAGLRINHALDVMVKSFEVTGTSGAVAPAAAPAAPTSTPATTPGTPARADSQRATPR